MPLWAACAIGGLIVLFVIPALTYLVLYASSAGWHEAKYRTWQAMVRRLRTSKKEER